MSHNSPPPGTFLNPEHPQLDGLVSWWPFNDLAGPMVHDVQGLRNHAKVTHDPVADSWTGSPRGGALMFNGTDYGNVAQDDLGEYAFVHTDVWFTLCAWLYLPDLTQRGIMCGNAAATNRRGFLWIWETAGGVNGTEALRLSIYRASGSAQIRCHSPDNATLPGPGWNHVACVGRSPTDITFFANGSPLATTYNSTNPDYGSGDCSNNLYLGAVNSNDSAVVPLVGHLSDLRIYDRPLSSLQLSQIMSNPWEPFESAFPFAPEEDQIIVTGGMYTPFGEGIFSNE